MKSNVPACPQCAIQLKTSFDDAVCFWLPRVLLFQRELNLKVQIFEKKVESYKTMTHKLSNTVEYIKVKSLSHLTVFIDEEKRHGTHCRLHRLDSMHIKTIYKLSCLTQYQAGQAEKQIKVEFERLHNALVTEEALRLKALATEEEEKTAAIQELIENTNKDIVALKELIDSLKKEMGNEDLPLLRVRESSLSPRLYLVS